MPTYTLLPGKIGSGGYSTVQRCTRDTDGAQFACKLLSKAHNKPGRIERELVAFRRASVSPHVAKLIDTTEDAHTHYLVQELCAGGTLHHAAVLLAPALHPCDERTAARVVRQVLLGLTDVQAAGVIHGDVKAANVLLTQRAPTAAALASDACGIKLCDFGASTLFDGVDADELVYVDELVGTPYFMAPEALAHNLTPKSDTWGVGCLCFQLLRRGRAPFEDADQPWQPRVRHIWQGVLHGEPAYRDEPGEPELSPAALDFMHLCLRKLAPARPSVRECLEHPWLRLDDDSPDAKSG